MIKFIKNLFKKKIPCDCAEVSDFVLVKERGEYQSSEYMCVRCTRTYYNPIYGGSIRINPVMKNWFVKKAVAKLLK